MKRMVAKLFAFVYRIAVIVIVATVTYKTMADYGAGVPGSENAWVKFAIYTVLGLFAVSNVVVNRFLCRLGLPQVATAPPRVQKQKKRTVFGQSRHSVIDQVGTSVANGFMNFGESRNTAWEQQEWERKKKEADQRAWDRYQAKKEAAFQDRVAERYAGTYDGYKAHNRANAAWQRYKDLS